MPHPKPKPTRPPTDSPTAWMAVWERARIDGDADREAQAARELRRLGVRVDDPPPRRADPAA